MTQTTESPESCLFQNPDAPQEDRIDDLLSRMTLDEKIVCLSTNPSVPRLGVNATGHLEGLHGLAVGGPGNWGRPSVIFTTTFPQQYGLGETWDPEAVERAAQIESHEARWIAQSEPYKRSGLVIRAPNADLGRDPRWGRTEECFGEDAYFNGVMVQAFVRGLQGDDPKYWRTSSLMKHFLANSNENARDNSSSDFDERLWREYYSVPFRMGIEAGSRAFMAAYNSYNGIPCVVHPMLETITRAEWGNDGIICTDGGAMRLLVDAHKYVPDYAHACAAIIKNNVGQFLDRHVEPTNEAIEKGLVTEADIDRALRGNFRVMLKLGLLDPPERVSYASIKGSVEPWLRSEHRQAARRITCKSVVLLKNERETLPLVKNDIRSIAVIGRYAGEVYLDWYSGTPPYTVTPLDGIRAALTDAEVLYSNGSDLEEAVRLAKRADSVLLFVGNHPIADDGWEKTKRPEYGKEAVDREIITLADEELVKAVHAVNPRAILVLVSSFPYAINWSQQNLPAILHVTHNSQEMGNAISDVIFGNYNPAGRLTQTWVKALEDLPAMMDYDIRNGRTYMYFGGEPLYPFGHGLSYSKFEYSDFEVSSLTPNEPVVVTLTLKNVGSFDGDEVVQIYAEFPYSNVERPKRKLVGFERVETVAGVSTRVEIEIDPMQLAYWNVDDHAFIVEPNCTINILAGASSSDIRLRSSVNSPLQPLNLGVMRKACDG